MLIRWLEIIVIFQFFHIDAKDEPTAIMGIMFTLHQMYDA